MIKLIEDFVRSVTGLKVKIVKKGEPFLNNGDLKNFFPLGNNYLLFFNSVNERKKLYLLKRFIDELLKVHLTCQNNLTQLEILKKEVYDVISSNESLKNLNINNILLFSFIKTYNISYVVFENDEVIYNENVDNFTIDIYRKKLDINKTISLPFKDGEIYALHIEHYKIVLLSQVKLSTFIKDVIRSRLIWLNFIYKIEGNFYIDKLTSLYNREKFLLDIKKKNYSIVFINIKNFKKINQIYGSQVGDKILKETSKRLKQIAKECKVYRVFSDHFALLIPSKFSMRSYLDEIAKSMDKKFLLYSRYIDDYIEMYLDTQIIYFKQRVENIIEKANISFHKSNQHIIKFSEIEKLLDEEDRDYNILLEAIQKGNVIPFFQKVVRNSSYHETAYFEALMRIRYNGKILPPVKFIEIAKENGLYGKLNFIIIENSIKSVKLLNSMVSINVDIYDILQKDFFSKLEYILRKNSIDGSNIQVEVLETEDIYKNYDEVEKFLKNIKRVGCKVALDDFGSGYSNFVDIKDLPIDTLKIDMSLVKEIVESERNFSILETISKLSRSLNIKTTAEGVGSVKIYEKLKSLPIDYLQGYYFAKPLDLKEIVRKY